MMREEGRIKESGRVDLHLHTRNSDGENSVDEVIRQAAEEGIKVIAITDHNKFSLNRPFTEKNMEILPGCEFSASYMVSAQNETVEIHVIGLFPDGVDPNDFTGIFAGIHEGKRQYVKAILEQLEERGISVSLEEVQAVSRKSGHIGRHQIADVLIRKGYAEDVDDAFDRHIGNFSPYYIPSTRYIRYAPLAQVVRQIVDSGGIPILAHPYGYLLNEENIEKLIADFKEVSGKTGAMEVYYELYLDNPKRMTFLKRMAEKYGLLASAASDRHREGQPYATTDGLSFYREMVRVLHQNSGSG